MSSRRRQQSRSTAPTQVSDSLQNFTAGLNTGRDKQSYSRYAINQQSPMEYEAAYQTDWLARAIIDKKVDDSTRKWREWQATADQTTALEKIENKHHLKKKVNKALKLAGLYGGAGIFFDVGDDSREPLDLNRVRKDGLRFCTVLTRNELQAGEVERDPLEPNYGNPNYYTVQRKNSVDELVIHYTRLALFHGAENPNANEAWGDSRLRPVMDALKQYTGTAANVSSLVYEAKVDVFSIQGLTALVRDQGNLDKLVNRYSTLALMKGNNGMMVIDKENESYDQKNITFAGLTDIMDKFEQQISGAAGYPRAILFGTSTGGLGSTGEMELSAYYDRINAEQENDIQPALELLDEVIIRSALGSRPEEVYYNWRSLWQMSDEKRAEIGNKQADTVVKLVGTGIFDNESLQKAAINMFTEAGTMPGLEGYTDEDTDDNGEPSEDLIAAVGGTNE